MKYIKISICLIFLIANVLQATVVVFLQGACRSGKSSICNAIKNYKNWESIDSLYVSYSHEIFQAMHPLAFSCIKEHVGEENISPAINKNMFVFKDTINEEQKNNIRKAIQEIQYSFKDPDIYARHRKDFATFALETLCGQLNKGFNVITSLGWYFAPAEIQRVDPTSRIISALMYCPFNIIVRRLIERNKICLETNNVRNHRFFMELIKSFTHFYELSTDPQRSIDILEKAKFLSCLHDIDAYLPDSCEEGSLGKFIVQEYTRQQLLEYRESILAKFENNEFLYVVPKISYDILLRTDKYAPEECAAQIISRIV